MSYPTRAEGLVNRINFFWFLVFRHEERETQFLLCWLSLHCSSVNSPAELTSLESKVSTHWPNKRAAHPVDRNWTGLAQVRISTSLAQRQKSTKCFFQKSPKFPAPRFRAWRHSHPSSFPIWGFYFDICDCHILRARAWTVLNVCTCTCTKPNNSKPNQTEW